MGKVYPKVRTPKRSTGSCENDFSVPIKLCEHINAQGFYDLP